MAASNNTLGSFIVDVSANIARFEADLGRANRIAQREAQKIQNTLAKVAGALGAGIGVGSFGAFVKGAIDAQDAADELAQKLGVSTEAASRLQTASKFAAGGLETIAKAATKLIQQQSAAASGAKEQAALFREVGISATDSGGKLKGVDVLIGDIAAKFDQYEDGAARTALAIKLFGKSGADVIPMLNDWNSNVVEAIKLADQFGATVTTSAGQAAAKFNDDLAKLGLVSQGVGNQLAQALLPALTSINEQALTFFRSGDWQRTLRSFGEGAQWVAENIGQITAAIRLLGEVTATVYATKLIYNGTALIFNLVQQTTAVKGLIVAQSQWWAATAGSFTAAYKSIGLLGISLGVVASAVIGWKIGQYLSDQFLEARLAGIALVSATLEIWERIKQGAQIAWAAIVSGFDSLVASAKRGAVEVLQALSYMARGQGQTGFATMLEVYALTIEKSIKPAGAFGDELNRINAAAEANVAAVRKTTSEMAAFEIDADLAAKAAGAGAKATESLGRAAGVAAPLVGNLVGNQQDAKKAADDLAKANAAIDKALRTQIGSINPLYDAWSKFNDGVVEAVKDMREQIAAGADSGRANAALQATIESLARARDKDIQAIRKQADIMGEFYRQMAEDRVLIGLTERQRALESAVRRVTEQYRRNVDEQIPMLRSLQEVQDEARSAAGAFYDYAHSIEEWSRVAEQVSDDVSRAFGDFYSSAVFDFGSLDDAFKSLGDSLRNTAQRVVADLISEFFKLQIINPLLNQIFGANLQTGGSMLSGAFGGNGMLGGITQAFSGQGGIFSSQNWISAGRSLWSGFFGTGTATAAAFGSSTVATGLGSFGWAGAAPWMTSGGMVGLGGAGMTASPWMTSGGMVGLGGGGYGAAGGAASSAAASSMAIPIAGWIVAAVLANVSAYEQGWRGDFASMDMGGRNALLNGATGGGAWASALSGELFRNLGLGGELSNLLSGEALWGQLFGRRKPRMTGYGQDFAFGPDGAGGEAFVNWRAKGGLFSSDRTGSVPTDLDAQTERMLEAFWGSVTRSMEAIAGRFGGAAPEAIAASWRAEYNKKGDLVSNIGTILGREYNEAWEVFQQRVLAENQIAALAATSIGAGASEIAERWRDDAAVLADGTAFLIAAADDIRRGAGLLTEASNSLTTAGAGGLGAVVALVEDLALAGEAMNEAYARIYGSAQLLDQALALAGVQLGRAREDVVRFAVAISEAAGGLDQARALWEGYFSAYYSASEAAVQQLLALQQQAAGALAGIGLDPGTSMEAFREAFEAALPKLSAEDVVRWLEAANALAAMTAATADLTNQAQALLQGMGLTGYGLSAARREILGIEEAGRQAAEAANALARAQGRAGASAVELARIQQWTASQIEAAIRRLQQATMDMLAELRGGIPGSLGAINDRIADIEGAMGGVSGAIDAVSDAGQRLFEEWARGVQTVQGYLDSMLLGDLSALNPAEQLAEARRQLEEMAAAAAGGDAGALANLPGLSDVYLRLLRDFGASGADYNEGFGWVRELLGGLVNLPNPGRELAGAGAGGTTTYVAPSPELIELYNARDALLAEQQAQHQAALWAQVTQNIADLAYLMQRPVLEVMDLYQVSLRELADGLGIDLRNLTAESVLAIGNMATTLGLSLTDITTGLGINLTALATGLTDLTGRIGIDLSALTVESTRALADLAGALGGDLSDLATALGLDLGALANAQGLLNQALAAEINGLPADQRDLLAPLLEAIAAATSEADANAAIAALEAAVLGLPPNLQNLLAPYLAGVGIAPELTDLDYLGDIHEVSLQQRDLLTRIANNLQASNEALDIPAYATGTGYVPRTGPALLHEGEVVLPRNVSDWARSNGLGAAIQPRGGGGSSELRALREEVVLLRRAVEAGDRANTDAIAKQTNADRANTDTIAAAVSGTRRGYYRASP